MITHSEYMRHALGFCLLLSLHCAAIADQIFDIPVQKGQEFKSENLKGLIPISAFGIRKEMTPAACKEYLADYEKINRGYHEFIIPDGYYFEHLSVDWEDGKMRSVRIDASALPLSRDRFIGLINELERLLGKPDDTYFMKNSKGVFRNWLHLEWIHESHVLRLEMKSDRREFLDLNLSYFPGPDNPGLKRVNEMHGPDRVISKESVNYPKTADLLDEFMEAARIFPKNDDE